jgi:hypothetical protein
MKKFVMSVFMMSSLQVMAQHTEHKAENFGYADSVNAGLIKDDNRKGSPVRMAMANIGASHVHITYGSPGVKGRVIWGGLVSYDQFWCAGAHNATWVSFSEPVLINGKKMNAGKYSFFIIAKSNGPWTVIFNSDAEMHLADEYEASKDVLRLEVTPMKDATTSLPRLTFTVKETAKNEGYIQFAWDKKILQLQVKSVQ